MTTTRTHYAGIPVTPVFARAIDKAESLGLEVEVTDDTRKDGIESLTLSIKDPVLGYLWVYATKSLYSGRWSHRAIRYYSATAGRTEIKVRDIVPYIRMMARG